MTDEAIIEMMKQLLDSKLDTLREDVNSRFDAIQQELAEVKIQTTKTATILENETNKNVQLLAEGYNPLANDVNQIKDDLEVVKFDVDVIKKVVTTHSSELNKLKKAK